MKYFLGVCILLCMAFCFLSAKYANPFKLYFIMGKKGSGKSTLMIKRMLKLQRKGWTIYTDMHEVNIPGVRLIDSKAYSCDILPCSGGHPEWHLQQDVIPLLREKWDMIIAFPPCTFLSNAGARHLWKNHELNHDRYLKGLEARDFFMQFYNADCPRIAMLLNMKLTIGVNLLAIFSVSIIWLSMLQSL